MKDCILKIGDYVYASDWCFGEIVGITHEGVWVEFDTGNGGGTAFFDYDEVELAECPLNG